jgi:trehalose 2-sulfotransferase
LDFLELDTIGIKIPSPPLAQTADKISEQWVQRFREERQNGWENRGW